MIVGYAMVSTSAQNEALQIDALNRDGCVRLYVDRCSGARASRPELDRMLDAFRAGDTVVVWNLDRLGRSVGNLVNLMNRFQLMGMNFRSVTERMDTATPAGALIFKVFASMTQFERDLIRERTHDGEHCVFVLPGKRLLDGVSRAYKTGGLGRGPQWSSGCPWWDRRRRDCASLPICRGFGGS